MAIISVRDVSGNSIPFINIRIAEGHNGSDEAIYDVFTDYDGNTGWPIPYWPHAGYTLHFNYANVNPKFKSFSLHTELIDDIHVILDSVSIPIEPLRVEGTKFYTGIDKLFQWRSFSLFLAYRKFLNESIEIQLNYLSSNKFNMIRVFGPLNWQETPDYNVGSFNWSRLGEFFSYLASKNFYCEFVPICYKYPTEQQRLVVQMSYDIARPHPNVLIEICNEPSVGDKCNPIEVIRGVNRYSILSSYGIYQPYYTGGIVPHLDYVTIHITRDSAWARKARHAQELQVSLGIPVISDEPAKAVESEFTYPGSKTNSDEFVWHHGICSLYNSGSTLHTEFGKWGGIPSIGSNQQKIVDAVHSNIWERIGPEWQLGKYFGSHSSSSPINHVDNEWAYSSIIGNRALSVRVGNHKSIPRSPWREIESWGPSNSIMLLEK